MNDSEIRKLIREEIKQAITPILMGFVSSSKNVNRVLVRRMANEGPMDVRNIQPYGFSSNPPPETQAILVPLNGDPTNMNSLGNYDTARPKAEVGESIIYNNFTEKLSLLDGVIKAEAAEEINMISERINLGSESATQPLLLGDIVQQLFSDILDLIVAHTHEYVIPLVPAPAQPGITTPPSNAGGFDALKTSPVADGMIKSEKSFTE